MDAAGEENHADTPTQHTAAPSGILPRWLRCMLGLTAVTLLAADAYCPYVRGEEWETATLLMMYTRAEDNTIHVWYRTREGQLMKHTRNTVGSPHEEEPVGTVFYRTDNHTDIRFGNATWKQCLACRWCRSVGITLALVTTLLSTRTRTDTPRKNL